MDKFDQQEERRKQEELEEKLQAFGASLGKMRDEWIAFRQNSGWDRRVKEDIDQYNSIDAANRNTESMMGTVERGFPNVMGKGSAPTRSTVFIGMTRQKTNAAEARLTDILLPTDERNWGIRPTPNPELAKKSESDKPTADPVTGLTADPVSGEPVLERDIVKVEMDLALEKSVAMEREIDDQLVECDYNGEVRKMIHDSAVMGTGILKGPIVANKTRKSWSKIPNSQESVYVIEMVEEIAPRSMRVDPRNVWEDPACGDNIQNGRGIYERTMMTRKEVRKLVEQPGYMKAQIRRVLEQGPASGIDRADDDNAHRREQASTNFEVWEYWGEIEPADARAAGVNIKDEQLDSISACVVMINNTVVKVFPNPLDTGDLPYDFFAWEKVPDTPRGLGVPYLMRAQQKVMNAAWRNMMDNAGITGGPQIIVKPKIIQPADGTWNLTPRKIWNCTDPAADVRQAFTSVQFDSRQADLANIIEMATKLADEETAVPLIAQGQERNIPDTVGGVQMLMQSANVVLRRLVKQFDDQVTKPHIRRYYDFNMMYSEKDDIKGDFEIDARGSSAMVVRDIRNQAIMQLLGAAANPSFNFMIDTKRLFEKALEAQHVDPRDIMLPDEEIKQRQEQAAKAQPKDPALQVAELRANAEMERTKVVQQSDMQELQLKQQLAQQEQQFRMQQLQIEMQIEMLKLAQTKELTLEQIKAEMADTAMKERSKAQLFNAEAQLKIQTGQGI